MKIKKQNGFTLVEMLIVVAIIAILIMVSIPMIGATLEKARVGVDEANERTAMSLASTWYAGSTAAEKAEVQGKYSGGYDGYILQYYVNPDNKQGYVSIVGLPDGLGTYGQSTKDPRGFGGEQNIPKGLGIRVTLGLEGEIEKLEWLAFPNDILNPRPGA